MKLAPCSQAEQAHHTQRLCYEGPVLSSSETNYQSQRMSTFVVASPSSWNLSLVLLSWAP
jgi:hypothetical protein